jgi:acetolactate synthase regulatory subunit
LLPSKAEDELMKNYHVRYRNTQGTFLRILTAVQRRGLDMSFVHAEQVGDRHLVTLALLMNPKQAEQVCREWHAIVDVEEVSTSDSAKDVATVSAASHVAPARVTRAVPRVAAGAVASA